MQIAPHKVADRAGDFDYDLLTETPLAMVRNAKESSKGGWILVKRLRGVLGDESDLGDDESSVSAYHV